MVKMFKKILCKIGIHRPMKWRQSCFMDNIAGKMVHEFECNCGIYWLGYYDSFFRVKSSNQPNIEE